jgi:flagellar protein FliO/FliZ
MDTAVLKLSMLALAFQADDGPIKPEQFQTGGSVLWMFVQTILALGFVCLLAYLLLSVVLPRLKVGSSNRTMIHVMDRTPLDQRRSLYVVEVTGRWLLIGASESGVQMISELDPEKAEQEVVARKAAAAKAGERFGQAKIAARSTFSDVLARMVNRRQ